MADVEIKRKVRLSRKQAGERLIAVGKALVGGSKSELEFDGESIHFTVADQVNWEFELEVEGDEIELEIELKWSDAAPAAPAAPAAKSAPAKSAPAAKRARSPRRSADGAKPA
jgi:amphi-Trp domain-containing protein